jgi:hypothetical protein
MLMPVLGKRSKGGVPQGPKPFSPSGSSLKAKGLESASSQGSSENLTCSPDNAAAMEVGWELCCKCKEQRGMFEAPHSQGEETTKEAASKEGPLEQEHLSYIFDLSVNQSRCCLSSFRWHQLDGISL